MILPRTRFLRAVLVRALCFAVVLLLAPSSVAGRLDLEVRESAGLARGGYPVHAQLKLSASVPATTRFRLLGDGKPVVAQFRPDGEGPTARWWLDFQTDIGPFETRKYTVEFGEDVPAGPERTGGHKLTRTDEAFSIANAPYITWTVPHDLRGFLRSVDFPPSEFLRPDSPGLLLRDRRGRQHSFSGSARVVRQGPMAVALRFEKPETQTDLLRVSSTADLTFPAPVSWVELDWHVEDPLDNVSAVGFQLDLDLGEPTAAAPTLVDFGASSVVYTSLRPGQEAELSAGPQPAEGHPWKVLRGERDRLTPIALGAKQAVAPPVEGWAHVMDRKNCLALAVDAFGRDALDRIGVAADGKVMVWREYAPAKTVRPKRLHVWLHFVFFPPQYSAGASPQQMQAPLEVRVKER